MAKPRPSPPKAWIDMHLHGCWGVECDDPDLTFDGHYICLVPHIDPEKGREIAQRLVDALEGRRPFRRTR